MSIENVDSLAGTAFSRRSDARSALVVLAHFALSYLPVYLAAATQPGPLWIGLWLWFGLCQNGVINLMHECAHKLAFRRPWANDLLGGLLLAPLVLTDFREYRERHWDHHRQLGTVRDPKLVYRTDVRGVHLLLLVARCAIGLEALRRLTERPEQAAGGEANGKRAGLSLRLVLAQALFLASIFGVAWAAHGELFASLLAAVGAYAVIYGYGTASLTVLAAALRAIAEHQVGDHAPLTDGDAALRNFRCNPFTRLVFGAYGFGEHATHHKSPGVPYYHLPVLTAELAARDPNFAPTRGYVGMLVRLVALPARSTAVQPGSRG